MLRNTLNLVKWPLGPGKGAGARACVAGIGQGSSKTWASSLAAAKTYAISGGRVNFDLGDRA